MIATSHFGCPPVEDSKRKSKASLDQLKEKFLIHKDTLIEEYGQFTVYWPIEELREEASEGKEEPGGKTNDYEDGCTF